MKEQQTSLFSMPKNQSRHVTKYTPVLTQADRAYQALEQGKLANQLHIYSHAKCIDLALDYVNGNRLALGETVSTLCKRASQTDEHGYYHYSNHHFIRYNGWIMKMILKEYQKHAKDKASTAK